MWDGIRRLGKPKTEAQRRARHKRLYGTEKLPPRGTGILGRTRNVRKRNA